MHLGELAPAWLRAWTGGPGRARRRWRESSTTSAAAAATEAARARRVFGIGARLAEARRSVRLARESPAIGLAISPREERSRPAAGLFPPPPPSAAWCGRCRSARPAGPRAARRIRSRSESRATTTWAASAPKPEVTVQTCRSWTERTPSTRADRGADRIDVEARRRRLHQHVEGLLDQPPGGGEDEAGDQQADDRVDDRRAAGEHDGAGDDDAERAERVGGAVAQHPLEVDVLALAAGEDQRRGDVAGQAEEAERQHAAAVDPGRVAEPADRGDRDPHPDRDQQQAVDQRRQHLGALVAEGAAAAGRARGEARGDQRQGDRADVGEQVAGVGEDRQRAGEDRRRRPRPRASRR